MKQAELGKGKELSSTDESIDDTDVKEAQQDLITCLLCVITPRGRDFVTVKLEVPWNNQKLLMA